KIGPEARPALPALLGALKDDDGPVFQGAVDALGRIGREGVPALIDVLKGRQEIAFVAAKVLGNIGPEARAAGPALIDALEEEKLTSWAAEALGKIGPDARDAVAALGAAYKDDGNIASHEAARALGRIGAPAVPTLIDALNQNHRNQRWAAEALAEV